MRAGTVFILTCWVLLATGCASCDTTQCRHAAAPPTFVAGAYRPAGTSLLFDARPGLWHGSEFASRSDWPSTDTYYPAGETIFFRERFYDYQGPGINHPDHTYRRFETYRTGVGYR